MEQTYWQALEQKLVGRLDYKHMELTLACRLDLIHTKDNALRFG